MSNDIVGQWFAKADSDFKIATAEFVRQFVRRAIDIKKL
jgi:hypothetical protein